MSSRHHHHRERSRSETPERRRSKSPESRKAAKELPHGAEPISESDYFLRCNEFRVWLKDEKDRYLDELSGEKSRSYFRKFVKVWNKGKLPKSLYAGIDNATQPATSQTKYKWSFAVKNALDDDDTLESTRRSVAAATNKPSGTAGRDIGPSRDNKRVQGPSMPSRDDLVLNKERAAEDIAAEKAYARKRGRDEVKESIEDMVGPRESGREGQLEKKRMKRDENRAFQSAKDEGFDALDDNTLMGGGDSFKARIAQRDAARRKFNDKRMGAQEERDASVRERREAMMEKEKATMDMFKKLAKERFG